MAKTKEVATKKAGGSVEESFGSAPSKISVVGGTMATFGHKPSAGVWPSSPVSVDQKTGFPKDHMSKSKGIKP